MGAATHGRGVARVAATVASMTRNQQSPRAGSITSRSKTSAEFGPAAVVIHLALGHSPRESASMPDTHRPPAPDVSDVRVRESFERQAIMKTLGATLTHVGEGVVHIALPYSADLAQQHGFLHAGVLATILDSACGYAAYSLMPADAAVLSVEFKLNLLAPAAGDHFVARARVVRAGKKITVSQAEAFAVTGAEEKLVAIMTGTMMCVRDNPTLRG